MQKIVTGLKAVPFLPEQAQTLLNFLDRADAGNGFAGVGTLCYGSHKTKALRVGISAEQEAALFYDRLWSLVRHPERWAEHHHLAGTTDDVKKGIKGNYTALVSDFAMVN